MRLKDREITDFDEIVSVLDKCDTVRIGINGGKYPYVVPVSFGYEVVDGKIVIYIHGAMEGMKNELIAKDPNVCVQAEIMRGFVRSGFKTTADYESIIGFGKAEIADEADAVKGIELLMAHCGQPGFDGSLCIKMGMTRVYKITLESVTGKKRFTADEPEVWS